MTTYGSKVYGSFRYGSITTSDVSVYPFTTSSLDYGVIDLSWVYPKLSWSWGVDVAKFTSFVVVRSSSGFPVTVDDGDVIFKTTATSINANNLWGTTASIRDYGGFYDKTSGDFTSVYGVSSPIYPVKDAIVSSTLEVNDSSKVAVGQLVYGYSLGVPGGTRVVSKSGTTIGLNKSVSVPKGTQLKFSPMALVSGKAYYYSVFISNDSDWVKVGNALGTCIKDYKTADTLYGLLPEVYVSDVDISSTTRSNRNKDLYNFLRTVAVSYDFVKTKIENSKNRYDIFNVDGKLIPAIMDQMGFIYESSMGAQQGRKLLVHGPKIHLNKGTINGLKEFLPAFTGFNVSILPVQNLFLTLNCSSFEGVGTTSPYGFWDATGPYTTIESVGPSVTPPYTETNSPSGYPNSRNGVLRVTSTVPSPSTTTLSFRYGIDDTSYSISSALAATTYPDYVYQLMSTDTANNFKVGQYVSIQGMTGFTYPSSYTGNANGILPIVKIIDSKTFAVANTVLSGTYTIQPKNTNGTARLYDPTLCGIPVTAGLKYAFSIYSKCASSYRTVTVGIKWYDKNGTELVKTTADECSLSNQDVGGVTSPWVRIEVSNSIGPGNCIAPTNAKYAVPYVSIANVPNNEVHYFDAAQFEQDDMSRYYADARRVNLYLTSTRINRAINPGFESNTTNWTVSNTSSFTTSTASNNIYPTSSIGLGIVNSTRSAKLVTNNTTSLLYSTVNAPVTSGKYYTLSGYVKATGSGNTVAAQIEWKTSGGSSISISTATFNSVTSNFSRTSVTALAPSNAATAVISFSFTGTSGDNYFVDSVLFEESPYVNPYFDGTTGYYNTDDIVWEQTYSGTAGTASTARSLYYQNRLRVQSRLDDVLEDYLPIGSTWALFIGKATS